MSLCHIVRLLSRYSLSKTSTCACFLSSKSPQKGIVKEIDPDTGEVKTKKIPPIPKITLLTGDNVSISTLEEAEKLAKRRDLKLVKILDLDAKSQRPVYKLMTGSEFHGEELKQRDKRKSERLVPNIKGEKVLLINAKIASHDLDTQLRKAINWSKKMYEVRVIISGASGNIETSEKVYNFIEKYFKIENGDTTFRDKRCKGSDIKFQITPPKYKDPDDRL